jgi:hypothetical protein
MRRPRLGMLSGVRLVRMATVSPSTTIKVRVGWQRLLNFN